MDTQKSIIEYFWYIGGDGENYLVLIIDDEVIMEDETEVDEKFGKGAWHRLMSDSSKFDGDNGSFKWDWGTI